MDNLFELIAFALFILASLFGGRKRGGSRPSEPKGELPDARRGQGGRAGRDRDASTRAEPPTTAAGRQEREEREPAATMVPDDLWAVLTGQRGTPAGTGSDAADSDAREGELVPAGTAGTSDAPGHAGGTAPEARPDGRPGERAGAYGEVRDQEARSLESIPEPDYPRVVSLERPLPPDVQRQLALQRAQARTARRLPTTRRRRARLPLALHDRNAVRRAVVLREVLGPPKGLEP